MVRQALERRGNGVTGLSPQVHQHAFDNGEHICLVDERGFQVDLGELRLAIGAEVLVAKTTRELEVPVEPGHHQQLLVDLRRLGQRVELTGVHATRHEVVASPLRGRLGEDRRFDFKKTEFRQRAT